MSNSVIRNEESFTCDCGCCSHCVVKHDNGTSDYRGDDERGDVDENEGDAYGTKDEDESWLVHVCISLLLVVCDSLCGCVFLLLCERMLGCTDL